ncbi:MAG: hypothetical protein ABIW46_09475 [Acidimicrobiales bacterium]
MAQADADADANAAADAAAPRAPWHFKLLVVSACGYLAWRGVQGVAWLVDRL